MKIGNPEIKDVPIKKEKLPMPEDYDAELVDFAKEQLKFIGSSLHELAERIIKEKPEKVFFMDKGARVFGTPMLKFLKDQGMENLPEVSFFNDDDFKYQYLYGDINKLDGDQRLDLFKKGKIFFIDETFSIGKGAIVLKKIKEMTGNKDIYYFALTKDIEGSFEHEIQKGQEYSVSRQQYEKDLEEIKSDKNFYIFNNKIRILFSKKVGNLYLWEIRDNDVTSTKYKRARPKNSKKFSDENFSNDDRKKEPSIPSASDYDYLYEFPIPKKEYYQAMDKKKYRTVAMIKKMIYDTLKEKK
jgi:hypothetical protein